jgi:serine phosphatase RsbU (regulator of sigma subunit)
MERYHNLRGEVKEISAELSQARRLHEALFPAPLGTGAIHMGFAYEPMREIGGDVLFVHRESASAALSIVLIDVSGHGIPAALSVNRLHGELLRFFSNYPAPAGESGRPGHVLANLNAYACAALAPQGVYATALVLRACPVVGTIEFANAGHPTAYLRKATGSTIDLPATATMLGVLDADSYLTESIELNFQPGDRVLAYTDGAMESRDAEGKDFTAERIKSVVTSATLSQRPGTGRLAPLADSLMAAVSTFRHGPAQDDTLIVELVHAGISRLGHDPQVRPADDVSQTHA